MVHFGFCEKLQYSTVKELMFCMFLKICLVITETWKDSRM